MQLFSNPIIFTKSEIYLPHEHKALVRNVSMSPHPVLQIGGLELGCIVLAALVGDVHHDGRDVDQDLQGDLVSGPA